MMSPPQRLTPLGRRPRKGAFLFCADGVTPTAFARQIGVPPNRVSRIIAGKRSVSADSALRFGRWFGVEPQFWLNLQSQFDLAVAQARADAEIRAVPASP